MTHPTGPEIDSSRGYDELWTSAWGHIQRVGPVHRHVHEHLARLVDSLGVSSILDVGCGSGDTLALLAAQSHYELAGVDVSERALELARARVPAAHLDLLDIEHARLDQRYELVVSVGVVEHLLEDTAAFANIAAMATRYVFISTIAGRMRPSEIAIGHVRNYSRLELARKLELAGLEVDWVRGWGFPFYSPLYRTASEWLPGGPPVGEVGPIGRAVANALYQLYRLNVSGHGDILWALGRVAP